MEEIATTGSTTTTTAYYGGLALSVNGALSYTLAHGLGSVSEAVTASNGAVTASQLYAPYGAARYASGTLPGSRGFTGQVSDAATSGLDYNGARYYDPLAGQFTSADTTLVGGLNRYAYVGGNPETRTDPSGHMTRSPDYQRSRAMQEAQNQRPTVYANQWSNPGTAQEFVSFVGQQVLGTDTLSQSFHTLFQDPHASASDKWKAAGVGLLTVGTDVLAFASLVTFEPEVGEGAREAETAWLAADDAGHVATVGIDTGGAASDLGGTVQSTQVDTRGDLTRVGRWMLPDEYGAMTDTGMVQEGSGGTTYVAHPADPAAYLSQARSGSVYVEFDVPQSSLQSSLRPGGKVG